MTKSELIEQISLSKGLSKTVTEQAVNMVFDRLTEALVQNQRVEIRGFGSFEIRRYGSYKGRNPRTGSAVIVRPKRLPFFKPGKEMKDLVNTSLRRTSDHAAVVEATPLPLSVKIQ
jgi:integration host factor subunit beta